MNRGEKQLADKRSITETKKQNCEKGRNNDLRIKLREIEEEETNEEADVISVRKGTNQRNKQMSSKLKEKKKQKLIQKINKKFKSNTENLRNKGNNV